MPNTAKTELWNCSPHVVGLCNATNDTGVDGFTVIIVHDRARVQCMHIIMSVFT